MYCISVSTTQEAEEKNMSVKEPIVGKKTV